MPEQAMMQPSFLDTTYWNERIGGQIVSTLLRFMKEQQIWVPPSGHAPAAKSGYRTIANTHRTVSDYLDHLTSGKPDDESCRLVHEMILEAIERGAVKAHLGCHIRLYIVDVTTYPAENAVLRVAAESFVVPQAAQRHFVVHYSAY